MKLVDLVTAADDARATPRFIRYLIAQNVMPPPQGGRAHAEYDEEHLAAIRRYLELRDLGYSLEEARSAIVGAPSATYPVRIGPGLVLEVTPSEIGALDLRVVADKVVIALQAILEKETSDADRSHP